MPALQARHEVRRYVVVCAWQEPQINARIVEAFLQTVNRLPDPWAGIAIHAGKNVGRANHGIDILISISPRYCKRFREISRTVIDAGQNMAMQIDHS